MPYIAVEANLDYDANVARITSTDLPEINCIYRLDDLNTVSDDLGGLVPEVIVARICRVFAEQGVQRDVVFVTVIAFYATRSGLFMPLFRMRRPLAEIAMDLVSRVPRPIEGRP